MTNETFGHVARFVVSPDKRDEAISVLESMFEEVDQEAGTLLYLMHVTVGRPNEIWFYERYTDESAFGVHSASKTHESVLKRLQPLLAEPIEVHNLELLHAKAIPLPA